MSINNQTLEQLEYLLSKLSRTFPSDEENRIMTDISFQAKSDTGELNVLDDDDHLLATTVIPDWINNNQENFVDIVTDTLRDFAQSRHVAFEELSILHPYTLILVDDDKETITEIYEVDDESIVIDHEDLMQGLDEDLDAFIDNLLKD